jgi:preprotein translocase subunit YajC
MSSIFHSAYLLAVQVSSQPGVATEAGPDQAAAGNEDGGWGSMFMFLPMMLAIMFLYLMMTQKPQQKEQQRVKTLLENLKKNDKVVTAGGIVGTVVNTNSDQEFLTLKIDESNNTKMQVLKQSIVRVLKESGSTSNET